MGIDYKALGKRIKFARTNLDLTQEKLAEKVEISPTHISNIETGSTRVDFSTVVDIANVLGVTLDDLMCDSLIHARVQFNRDISLILEDCTAYEIRVIKDLIFAAKDSMRRNKSVLELRE